MALYFLSYDLRKPQRNYQPLYDKLGEYKAVRVLESLWCFNRYNTSASGLRDHFKQFVDSNDGLCVTEASDWATLNALATPKDLK